MKKAIIILSVCVALSLTFFSFYRSLHSEFTNWDDQENVIDNQKIKSLSWKNIETIFTSFAVGNYIPVTTLSYAIEYRFFKLDPFFYHATNLFFHLFNIIFIFWFIYLLTDSIFIPCLVSVLFGIHPLHVESVAWISERKDVLYAFFFHGFFNQLYILSKKKFSPSILYTVSNPIFDFITFQINGCFASTNSIID